jgi:hypothetical protein
MSRFDLSFLNGKVVKGCVRVNSYSIEDEKNSFHQPVGICQGLPQRFLIFPRSACHKIVCDMQAGTAPSLIAATRLSHTWLNNDLIKALYDAMADAITARNWEYAATLGEQLLTLAPELALCLQTNLR